MSALRRFWSADGQGGQALIMVAIVFLALLFAVGLAIDAGQLFSAKRTMQEAADAAAFAGAVVYYQGGTTAQAIAAATADATTNGFTNGVSSTTVTVNSPPASGPFASESPALHVEVIIVRQVQTSLVPAEAAFNPVRARGVAGAESLNNGYALIALNKTSTPDFTTTANADIHLSGGGAFINNTSSAAASNAQTDPSRFTVASPYAINLAGPNGTTWPTGVTVNVNQPQIADPFAGYQKPSTTGLAVDPGVIAGTTKTIPQGVFNAQITGKDLCHGIYILKGYGMAGTVGIDTNTSHHDPNTGDACDGRVFIFNTMTNYPSSGGTCQGITAGGSATITLLPLTTGIYAYMQIYQDPACTAAMSVNGNGTETFAGTVYAPSATISFSGNNATISGGQFIADKLDIGNGNLNIVYSSSTTANPRLPRLAE